MDFAELLQDVEMFSVPPEPLTARLREILAPSQLSDIPEGVRLPVHFVDGAVAVEQTDAVCLIAAVACAVTTSSSSVALPVVTAEAAIPVGGDSERFRSLLMAHCELEAAVATPGLVVVDGGLVTSLLAVASAPLIRDADVRASALRFTKRRGTLEAVAGYLDKVLSGHVVALPKQDTAQAYTSRWLTHPDLQAEAQSLVRFRDRPLIQALLRPGELLAPRDATEARRTKAAGDEDTDLGQFGIAVDDQLARLRAAQGLIVAYFKPHAGAQRTIKFETNAVAEETAGRIAAAMSAEADSPTVMEPFGQHLVDRLCKVEVRAHLRSLTAAVASSSVHDQGHRYRT